MNNIAYLVNAVDTTVSTSIIDTFACYQHTLYLEVVAWVCLGAAIFAIIWLRLSDSEKEGDFPDVNDGLIYNEDYLKECIRLSELMLSEVVLVIQSHHKKAFAIIAGAAAVLSFFLTRNMCGQLSDIWIVMSVILCIASVYFAILVLSIQDIGLGGILPYRFVNNYHGEIAIKSFLCYRVIGGDIERWERCNLYIAILKEQQEAIVITRRTTKARARNIKRSTLCMVLGLISSVGWVAISFGGWIDSFLVGWIDSFSIEWLLAMMS